MPFPELALPAERAENAAWSGSSRPPEFARNRRILIATGIFAAAYIAALVATIPAQMVVPLPDATGTVWNGSAQITADRVAWRWAPLRSLLAFGFAVDWEVTGPGSALAGRALVRPGSIRIEDASGTTDGALLQRAVGFSFACAMRLTVDLKTARIGGSHQGLEGKVRSDPGVCQGPGGAPPVAVPALSLDMRQTEGLAVINLIAAGQAREPLIVGGLSAGGHLSLLTTRQGAAVLPFATSGAGTKIETDL